MRNGLLFALSGLVFILLAYGFYRLLAALTLRAGRRAKTEVEAALARATPASASVLRLEQPAGVMRRPRAGSVRLLLSLEVVPAAGDAYRADALWQVDIAALTRVQPGQTLAVKIDADERSIIYPAERWAAYNWR